MESTAFINFFVESTHHVTILSVMMKLQTQTTGIQKEGIKFVSIDPTTQLLILIVRNDAFDIDQRKLGRK